MHWGYANRVLGSGRGSNAEAILRAQAAGRLGPAEVVQIFSDQPDAGILGLGAKFGVPARYLDPAPFKTKLEDYVPAAHTFAVNHDAFVDYATGHGWLDFVVNISSMIPVYVISVFQEGHNTAIQFVGWVSNTFFGGE